MNDPGVPARVMRALELVRQGAPVERAAKTAGVPRRALVACARAAPANAPAVLEALARLSGEVERRERQLRAAASWPFVLLISALGATGLVWGVALPALARLPLGGGQVSLVPAAVAAITSMLGLVALGSAVLGRVPVPGLSRAWASIDRHAFATCTHELHAAGVSLAEALRAASTWLPPAGRAAGDAIARALDAGAREEVSAEPALDPVALGLLLGAARSGTTAAALGALHTTTKVTMNRVVPREVARLHLVALLLAGVAVGVSFVTFYSTYVRAVTG